MGSRESEHESKASISASQVIAAALGGVTSVALASEIGGMGSLIGAVAAAVVSCVAPAVYGPILERSADKLRSLHDGTGRAEDGGYDASSHDPGTTDIARAGHGKHAALDPREAAQLRVARDTGTPTARTAAGTRIAPEGLRHAAAARRREVLRRRMTVAAIATSLVTVAITAGVISLATGGRGLGSRPGQPSQQAATTAATTQTAATSRAATQAQTQHAAQSTTPASSTTESASGSKSASTASAANGPAAASPTNSDKSAAAIPSAEQGSSSASTNPANPSGARGSAAAAGGTSAN
ncbi:hypothetical protein [uncultured Parolsenella sp.]|uniref:hypothetical protein n=1 Tax=uncultured Parolsenella sp. TaxID=2083008 RepID=UPI0027D958A8|nr:hypothetical protein [uncultured Parolsenella sp.]